MSEPTKEIQSALLTQELQGWENEYYLLTLRARVAGACKNKEVADAATKKAEEAAGMIEGYKKELEVLKA